MSGADARRSRHRFDRHPGMTKKEALRVSKSHISDVVHRGFVVGGGRGSIGRRKRVREDTQERL